MWKNICVIFLFMGILGLWLVPNVGAVDPEEVGEKYEAYWHSMAGGDSLITSIDLVCTWWEQLFDCHNKYHIVDTSDNGDGVLSPCDKIQADCRESWGVPHPEGYGRRWYHVDLVTVTLTLTLEPSHLDTMWVEFENGFSELGPAYADSAILPPVVCDTLHAVWPADVYCERYHLSRWIDNGDGYLSTCDTIDIKHLAPDSTITSWHVVDVAIDMKVTSCKPPGVPTTTQWGVIILVALIVTSGAFVMLRRRKAALPA